MRQTMLESSLIWNCPMDYKGAIGVLVAKAGPDKIAVHTPGMGWHVMDHLVFINIYKTEFPLMCPWNQSTAGWAMVPSLERHNGLVEQYALTPDMIEYALQDEAETTLRGFSREAFRKTCNIQAEADAHERIRKMFKSEAAKPSMKGLKVTRGLNAGLLPTVSLAC